MFGCFLLALVGILLLISGFRDGSTEDVALGALAVTEVTIFIIVAKRLTRRRRENDVRMK